MDLLLGQVSKGDRASGGRGTKKGLLHEVCDFMQQPFLFYTNVIFYRYNTENA